MKRHGFLKGCRLIAYAAQIYALGAEEFDRRASQQQRSYIVRELRAAGVDVEAIHWGALTRAQRRLVHERDAAEALTARLRSKSRRGVQGA